MVCRNKASKRSPATISQIVTNLLSLRARSANSICAYFTGQPIRGRHGFVADIYSITQHIPRVTSACAFCRESAQQIELLFVDVAEMIGGGCISVRRGTVLCKLGPAPGDHTGEADRSPPLATTSYSYENYDNGPAFLRV